MNIKDEIILMYIFASITVTMLITGSAEDGLTLLVIASGIWLILNEMSDKIRWTGEL